MVIIFSQFCCNRLKNEVKIDEGTTHYFDIYVKDEKGKAKDMSAYTCVFTLKTTDSTYDLSCDVDSNEIYIALSTQYTMGYTSAEYQIRAFNGTEVYQILQGTIKIISAVEPYTSSPI